LESSTHQNTHEFTLFVCAADPSFRVIGALLRTGDRMSDDWRMVVEDGSPISGVHMRVHNKWLEMRDGGLAPSRSRFDPAAVRGDLKHIFLVAIAAAETGRRFLMKVHGTEVNNIIGTDVTGKFLDDVLDAARHRKLTEGFDHCLDVGKPILEEFDSVFPGREFIRVSRLVTPLRDEGTDAEFILGSLARRPR